MGNYNKIVIVGNANSTFTKGYIKNVLAEKRIPITLICETNKLFRDFYNEYGIKVIAIRENSKVERIPVIKTLNYLTQVGRCLKDENADLVIIHYAWPYLLRIYPMLKLKAKTILVYWGSDLLRASSRELKKAKKAVELADHIVVLTDEMKDIFLQQYGKELSRKLSLIDFGVSAFNEIDKIQNSNYDRSNLIGEGNAAKTTVTIGYNARPEQQHIEITKRLGNLSEEEKNRLVLIYPMTYPTGKEEYILEIKKLSEELGFKSVFLTDYMDEQGVAKLCVSTDIFIHAQTTDALSTSMIEQLYSGTVVLNGSWLHYSFLDKLGIKYKSFDFADLPSILSQLLKQPIQNNEYNKEKLKANCSWEKCNRLWNELFKAL